MPGNLVDLTPEVIAQWPSPNFQNPHQEVWVTPVISILYSVATVALALRLWARYRKHGGGLGLDDAVISLGWIFSCAYTTAAVLSVEKYKSNRHMWDIPTHLWEGLALMTAIAEISYILAGACVRISVLLFYRRLVDDTCSRRWKYAIIAAIAFTASWVIACTCALTFSCTPVDAYWKSFSPNYHGSYHCTNTAPLNYIVGVLSIMADLYAVALPCIMTWNFTMPLSQKVALNLVFGASLTVVVACGVRNYYLFRLSNDSDFSKVVTFVVLLSQLEIQLGFICACMPALRILFRLYLQSPISKLLGLPQPRQPDEDSSGSSASVLREVREYEKGSWQEFLSSHKSDDGFPRATEAGELQSPALSNYRVPILQEIRVARDEGHNFVLGVLPAVHDSEV